MGHQNGKPGRFPDAWTDPLELYGDCIQELEAIGCDMDDERHHIKELVEKYGAKWVWDDRHRLFSVAKCLKDYPEKLKGQAP